MNSKNTKILYELGKTLYVGKTKSISESLMPFGFECGDGWFHPLRDLTIRLEALNIIYRPYHFHIEAIQVKEKFGTLRFYYDMIPHDSITEENEIVMDYVGMLVDEYIDKAEKECENVCEECGKQFFPFNKDDKVMTKGWIQILCKECAEKAGKEFGPVEDTSNDI